MEDIISAERRAELETCENLKNEQKRLVIFSDYGLDDACAAAYLLGRRGEFDNIDIVPVAGNVFCATAFDNAKKLLAAARDTGISLSGVRIVDCVDYYQECYVLPHIHGNDGMGDLFDGVNASPVEVIKFDEWCRGLSKGYRILSLGPCTMVKRAVASSKEVFGGKIVIMGGCTNAKPNFGKYEFNDGIDHESFLWTLRRNHVAVTLDTCHISAFDTAGVTYSGGGKLLDSLMNRCTELAVNRGDKHNYIYDQIAALALLYPDSFYTTRVFMSEIFRDMNELHLKEEFFKLGYRI